MERGWTRFVLAFCIAIGPAKAQDGTPQGVANALSAFQRRDFATAENDLKAYLRTAANDANALGFLGVVLDQERKYSEADDAYRRALGISSSPQLLNNYGNHLMASDKPSEARAIFLRVLKLDPKHPNALRQLAAIAMSRQRPAEALSYMEQVPAAVRDSHWDFDMGLALAATGKYASAEEHFQRAVQSEPENFQALYDLGLAASHAGHNSRAREVLQQALDKQPGNAAVMFDLAAVESALGEKETALQLLVRAKQADPQRADVDSMLAHTAAELGYFGDAVHAWDAYLKLKPGDALAVRERAFDESALGENTQSALADLRSFVRAHPQDAVGHYELGTAEAASDPAGAMKEFNAATATKAGFGAAYFARGLLRYRQGQTAAALADFDAAAREEPRNPTVLDRLGETYLSLGRDQDALRVLRRAAAIAPKNGTVLLHLGRALSKTGAQAEAAAAFASYRELGASKQALPHPAGLLDFLSLSPQEQMGRYREGVERTVKNDPQNLEAQRRLLALELMSGEKTQAAATTKAIAGLKPDTSVAAEVAQQLTAAGQYASARDFINAACGSSTLSPDLQLDFGIADFHLNGGESGLQDLDTIAPASRSGDYWLARFEMLMQLKRQDQAKAALRQVKDAKRPDLFRGAALELAENGEPEEAMHLLEHASAEVLDDPEVLLLKAMCSEMAGQNSESQFTALEGRWPDWINPLLGHAMVLEARGKTESARRLVDAAAALGANGAAVEYCREGEDEAQQSGPAQRAGFLQRGLALLVHE